MGTFISYLYTNFGIKNFLVIAPNLTIYDKLIEDFTNTTSPKYVFSGIDIFIHKPPTIITGNTYKDQAPGQMVIDESIFVNIFNIGKINAEVRSSREPLIKRLSEYIGMSYFNFLATRQDLVMLMDESHHYRADRGMTVLNELNPLLGLELTATPMVESGGKKKPFKNIVYEYSLAKAIVDGYVKEPAAATRENLDPRNFSQKALEELKIKDGIKLHRATKAELELYAARERVKKVKPFILIVCRETTHAEEVRQYISTELYDGYYADKTIIVHSNLNGEEKEENIKQLLSLEKEHNKIEIVIHVNMLKEGWDVTNLYTIIPLRALTSDVLLEQTLGRGLRLPYGQRTGNEFVDRVTVVAHDRFDKLIEEASKESSIIRAENIIKLEDLDIDSEKEIVTSLPVYITYIAQLETKERYARSEDKKEEYRAEIEVAKVTDKVINDILTAPVAKNGGLGVLTTEDIAKPEIKQAVINRVKQELRNSEQSTLFDFLDGSLDATVDRVFSPIVDVRINTTIDIPDIALIPQGGSNYHFVDFDLTTLFFKYTPTQEKIFIQRMRDEKVTTFEAGEKAKVTNAEQEILAELLNSSRIDYNACNYMIFKLIRQALKYIRLSVENMDDFNNIIYNNKKQIAKEIERQMFESDHFILSEPKYEIRLIRGVSELIKPNYSKHREDDFRRLKDNVPAYELSNKVFIDAKKSVFDKFKFDSIPEKDFAMLMDREDGDVIKWMRPAPKQFKIIWHAGREYEPDIVAETADSIYIIEIKAYNASDNEDVKLKGKAAMRYCDNVNSCAALVVKKKWQYVLIEDRSINKNSTFAKLIDDAKRWRN